MKLERITGAWQAAADLIETPLHPATAQGLSDAQEILNHVREASFKAAQASVAGTLTEQEKQAILEQLWRDVLAP